MSSCNDGSSSNDGWPVAVVALLLACFDVHQVDAEGGSTFAIDDFEDGDELTTDPALSSWRCFTYPGAPRASCGPSSPGFDSAGAWVVRFEVQDAPNGGSDHPGVMLQTSPRLGTLDLSGYEDFSFSAKLEVDSPSTLSATRLYLRFGCDGIAPSANVERSHIEAFRELSPEWSSFKIGLGEFARPFSQLDFRRVDCVSRVDSVALVIRPELPDGATLHGTLTVDAISIQ